ncbi:rho GTPase-activating protein 26-like isoform X1 [Polyodon spathula]|uniref:rho GTPase-activating protein 26-like isoform X1 n=2 Tax=Polyodon spathula TaxID=7913 RepID=UPI001B7EDF02|nr:rho GTPase-activating protein 26-like isoform X1 [Polyodon spathula]
MGLPALEFSDCYLDSPQFRERLKSHELELDKTNKFIKELIKDGKALVQSLNNMSSAKRKFAESLNEFKFQCIGDAETDDEICIARSLQEFAGVLKNLEDERTRMIENASDVLITPLERFRKEQIGTAKEARKKYEKETEKYCSVLEKHLNLSSKKKESHLLEADTQVDQVRQHFYEVSLEYVFKVQEVQERKMFEFVEPLLAFLQGLFTFYHHGYELAKDFSHFKTELTISIQNTRNRFEGTRSEVECLMKKMKENPDEHKTISPHTMQGYLFVQEKRSFVSTWVKHYCTYQREPKRVTIVLFDQKSGGKVGEEETFILKSCTRRKSDSIEKRFCFDVEAVDRPGVITMQALSEEDRRLWMEAMDGREPVYNLNRDNQSEGTAQLDSIGFNIVKKFIHAVETRGINEQGLYRIVGVNSKVQKLLGLLMDSKTSSEVDVDSATEWEIKTITSALKHYLRMLPGPLMTYQFQRSFIKAAKLDNQEARISEIHSIIHRLPEKNRQMMDLLMKHLANVANNHQQNLMTVANLGVVFGPTLLRPQEETVAAIMDIKFQNIVIEILIENHEKIFNSVPESAAVQPNSQLNSRRRSSECKPPSCSERPLTLFHTTPTTNKPEKRNRILNSSAESTLTNISANSINTARPNLSSLNCSDSDLETVVTKQSRPTSLILWSNYATLSAAFLKRLNPKSRSSIPTSPASPSPTSPRSPSWPMFSAPSSPVPASSTSSDSSPVSPTARKARALYACKAEHGSELSFIAGTIFDNVHPSREPGWLEGMLEGKTGLIPENYVEFL